MEKLEVSKNNYCLDSDKGSGVSSLPSAFFENLKLLSTDYTHNLSLLVKLVGEYLAADFVSYERFADDALDNIAAWHQPEGFVFSGDPGKSMAVKLLAESPDDICYLSGLDSAEYADDNIARCGFFSFLGCRIKLDGSFRGMICAYFQRDFQPSPETRQIMEFVAVLLGLEEARHAASASSRANESCYKRLYTMLRLVCDNEPDMIWAKDIEGRYIFANKAMCSKLLEAIDTDEPVGKTDHFFAERSCRMHAGDEPWSNNAVKCQETDSITIMSNAAQRFEEVYYVGGELRILDVHKAPLYNDDGVVIGTVGSARDVTAAKAVEKALDESQTRYSALLEANPDVMFLFNSRGDVMACKSPDNSLLLRPPEELIGLNMGELISEELFNKAMEAINFVRLTGQPFTYEYELPVGNARYFESRFVKCEDDLYLNIVRDITEKKIIDQELIRAKEEAEHVNRLKSVFLANMSHELRTPMNGILGFSEILLSMLDNEETKDMARTIHSSGKRLLKTLNLILDLSRVEANKQEIRLKPVELTSFLQNLARLFEPLAMRKGLALKFIAGSQDITLLTDPSLLEHVVNDLINNAIKFTHFGGVSICLEVCPQDEINCVIIKVSDTGIGIPKHKQEYIFDAFRQASEGYERSYEGTGLGLTISREYVELLGGRIKLSSEPGLGSEFAVSFPKALLLLEKNAPDDAEIQIGNNEAGTHPSQAMLPRILLIDDDVISHKLAKRMLEGMAEVDCAFSGEEGLKLAQSEHYQVILLDIYLGTGINGLAVIKEIRRLPAYAHTPVIAITAYSMVGDKEKFLAAGFSHYLSKPFSQKDIKQAIAGVFA